MTATAAAIVLALILYRVRRFARADTSVSDLNAVHAAASQQEMLNRWRARAAFTISWADGTRGDWDLHLRPVLAREFEQVTKVRAHRNHIQYEAAGEMLFGPSLWQWVDASQGARDRRDEPGPGRGVLAEILARLERA
ncbi:hypothetical protein ONR57_16550 [Hoyosella sp. YIM 151337]|uniref:hypothetical protein n=1 Tax=Hoyosella sp. YIM 151337 TaxID=2992742 RepID=UPI00223645D6|nr:hypothetical protein [Hoyosella sp. YIM 151337]MCW4354916.1 hypothetical protein [Hoyosella sp. YIM 151337]